MYLHKNSGLQTNIFHYGAKFKRQIMHVEKYKWKLPPHKHLHLTLKLNALVEVERQEKCSKKAFKTRRGSLNLIKWRLYRSAEMKNNAKSITWLCIKTTHVYRVTAQAWTKSAIQRWGVTTTVKWITSILDSELFQLKHSVKSKATQQAELCNANILLSQTECGTKTIKKNKP